MEIREILDQLKEMWDDIISLYHSKVLSHPDNRKGKISEKSLSGSKKKIRDRQAVSKNDLDVSEADMVKRFKILMSIPISSEKYPSNDLNALLEQIWDEEVTHYEMEARDNEFTLYRGRLDLLKQYAKERNKILLKNCLEMLFDSLKDV